MWVYSSFIQHKKSKIVHNIVLALELALKTRISVHQAIFNESTTTLDDLV